MTIRKKATKTKAKTNKTSNAAPQARTSGKKPRRVSEDYDPQWTDEEDNLRRDEGSDEVDDEEPREWDEEDHEERAIDAAEEDDDDRSVDRDEDDDDEDDDEEDDEDDEEDDGDVAPSPSFVQLPSPGAPRSKSSQLLTDADHFPGYLERLKGRREVVKNLGLVGAATGLPQLDEATGGLQHLTVLGAHTMTGKTAFAAQSSVSALRSNPALVVVYYLLDNMSRDDFFDQLVCWEARVDYANYEKGKLSEEDQKRVEAATVRLQKEILPRMRTLEADAHGGCFQGDWMFRCCRNFMEQVGAKRILVVLDMFDNLPLPKLRDDVDSHSSSTVRRIHAAPDDWRREQVSVD